MLSLRAHWEGKCERHPRYNPRLDGKAGIKGGCESCQTLFDRLLKIFDVVRETNGVIALRAQSK